MLLASRDIVGGIEWVAGQKDKENIDKLAEKQKKQFAGCEISGKKLESSAWEPLEPWLPILLLIWEWRFTDMIRIFPLTLHGIFRTIKHSKSLDEIYSQCDYITIHVPLLDSTHKMINKEAFDKMKDGVVLFKLCQRSSLLMKKR